MAGAIRAASASLEGEELVTAVDSIRAPRARESIRKGIAALKAEERRAAAEMGKRGAQFGFKGGRRSAKPYNVGIREAYAKLARVHAPDVAVSKLVIILSGERQVSPRTARRWIKIALDDKPPTL